MKKGFLIALLTISFSSFAQTIDVVNVTELQKRNSSNDTTYVLNFWATWCKPCIEELPYFLQLEKELINHPVKFIFVSLDDSEHLNSRVLPFIKKHEMKNVVILEDKDPNEWIPKIHNSWTGSIPATLIVNSEINNFYEQKLSYKELKEFVKIKKGAQ